MALMESVETPLKNRCSNTRVAAARAGDAPSEADGFAVAAGDCRGTTGSSSRDGCDWSCRIVCVALTTVASRPKTPPVLGLRSKRGKLLLETSRRI